MYKRIFEINPTERDEMFKRKPFGLVLREAKNGGPNEYVCQTDDPHNHALLDLFVKQFAIN